MTSTCIYESHLPNRASALLVLEDGTIFYGNSYGYSGDTLGEVVFCTAMDGYQETLTDPSYCGQIIVLTAPQVGNTGWNDEDNQNYERKIWTKGLVIEKATTVVSSWRATSSLEEELIRQKQVAIKGIDTRALVRKLREEGSMRGGIFSFPSLVDTNDDSLHRELIHKVRQSPKMKGCSLTDVVSTKKMYTIDPVGDPCGSIAILDLGIKAASPNILAKKGFRVHIVPAESTFDDITSLKIDGVLLANGPGDPSTAKHAIELTQQILGADIPTFGICFGNQVLGHALGRETYKMKYGHRGANIPVKDTTHDRVYITAQNHGFAIKGEFGEQFDTPYGKAELSHHCLNDGAIEGVRLLSGRAFAVQFHPEACPGPHDARDLFQHFTDLVLSSKKVSH